MAQSVPPEDYTTQPGTKIAFNAPYNDKHTYHIKVINSSACRIGFGIRNKKRLVVDILCGVLDPKEALLMYSSYDGIMIDGRRLERLDDVVIGKNCKEIEDRLNLLVEESSLCGLENNTGKTSSTPIKCQGEICTSTKGLRYLDSWICIDVSLDDEIKRWIKSALSAFSKCKPLLPMSNSAKKKMLISQNMGWDVHRSRGRPKWDKRVDDIVDHE